MEKAVNIAEKLAKISPKENNVELAQCYCEYSQSLEPESAVEKRSVLTKSFVGFSYLCSSFFISRKFRNA